MLKFIKVRRIKFSYGLRSKCSAVSSVGLKHDIKVKTCLEKYSKKPLQYFEQKVLQYHLQ